MNEINVGDVVISGTGQAGTVVCFGKDEACVLLRNGDLWYGPCHQVRKPQNQEDLDSAPIDVDRFEGR